MKSKEKKAFEDELNAESVQESAKGQPVNEENTEDTATLTHEEELNKELEEAQAQLADEKDKYLRLSAEFDNYRKRTMKEKAELILNGGEKKYQQHTAGNR